MAPLKSSKWLKAFEAFATDLRIKSKEQISTDEHGVPLNIWVSQRRFLEEVGGGLDNGIHSFNCLKSRQLGVTTLSVALVDVFWPAMHPGIIGCLVTDTEKNRELNRAMIEGYINSFPDGYFGGKFSIVKNNPKMMLFSNGSRLDFLVAGTRNKSTAWGEGQGYAFMHATELASYGSVDGFKSLEEGLAQNNPHRLFVRESTAKGYNHWRNRWVAGKNSLTERSFFIGWWSGDNNRIARKDPRFNQFGLHPPTREEKEKIELVRAQYGWKITPEQLAWHRWKRTDAGAEQGLLDQNQPWDEVEAFVMSGYSFFQVRVVDADMKALLADPPISKGYYYEVDGDFYNFHMVELNAEIHDESLVELKVWEEPVEGGKYAIGFDPAYGRNEHKDGSAILVFRCFADKMVQVAEYRSSQVEAKHAAWVAFHLCAAYRDCMINVELQGPGRLVMAEFTHLRQFLNAEMNLQRTEAKGWQDAAANARWYLFHREDNFGSGFQANYEATWRNKQDMLYKLKGAYVSREIEIKSWMLLNEMKNVVVDNDDIGAPESTDEDKKDDRVFALGLANLVWQGWLRKEMLAQGLTYDVVMNNEKDTTELATHGLNSLVYRFLARADEPVEQEPTWREKQGLQ